MDVAASIRTCPCVSLISFVGVIQHHVCMCVCVCVCVDARAVEQCTACFSILFPRC